MLLNFRHYPEMLNVAILINAPTLFSGLWALLNPILEQRTRQKVIFAKGNQIYEKLSNRIGKEVADWVVAEIADNKTRRPDSKKGNPKKYWIPPSTDGGHNSRGIASYVSSAYYVKTPGDWFEECLENTQYSDSTE